jgi:hypothetical protein
MSVCYGLRMNVRTNLLLPKELLDGVDAIAGPRGRSRYVAGAIEQKLRRDRQREAFEATFGTLSAKDYPHWSTPEQVVEWVRDRRSEVTDPGTEDDHVPDPRLDVRDRPSQRRPKSPRSMASDVRGG